MPTNTVAAAAEGMPEVTVMPDYEGALVKTARLVDLASWLALDNMRRVVGEDGKSEYRMPHREADQLMALLITTRDAADVVLAELPQPKPAVEDPALAFINEWERLRSERSALDADAVDDFHMAKVVPFEKRATDGDIPVATTAAGASAVLRMALAFEDIEDQDANLVRVALAYLEGQVRSE